MARNGKKMDRNRCSSMSKKQPQTVRYGAYLVQEGEDGTVCALEQGKVLPHPLVKSK